MRRDVRLMVATLGRIWRHEGNRGRRMKATGLYFGWQAWQRTVRRPLTVRLGESRRIRLYPHSVVAAFVLYYRVPDYEDMNFVRSYLRDGDLFIDVGANVGVYSIWASETPGVNVVAFEPSTVTFDRIIENVKLNRIDDRVTVLKRAVGDRPGSVHFTTGLDATNRVLRDNDGPTELVEQVTLDGVLAESRRTSGIDHVPSIIKIDVEGEEVSVLRGAAQLLERFHPALIVEVNDADGLSRTFDEFGYAPFAYDPEARTLSPTILSPGTNVIALADIQHATCRVTSVRSP